MFCAFHPERLAHDQCSVCQTPVCPECQRVLNGKVFCRQCLSRDHETAGKTAYHSPWAAALLSIFPGLGQVYNGQLLKGFVIFFTCWLIVPWLYGIYDAYAMAQRINYREIDSDPSPMLLSGCLLVIVLLFGLFWGGPFVLLKMFPETVKKVLQLSPEHQVKVVFSDISRAMKDYKNDHGVYPEDETDLHFAQIPYLDEMYCSTLKGMYYYDCEFKTDGYSVLAVPQKEGLPAYRMKTGGMVQRLQ